MLVTPDAPSKVLPGVDRALFSVFPCCEFSPCKDCVVSNVAQELESCSCKSAQGSQKRSTDSLAAVASVVSSRFLNAVEFLKLAMRSVQNVVLELQVGTQTVWKALELQVELSNGKSRKAVKRENRLEAAPLTAEEQLEDAPRERLVATLKELKGKSASLAIPQSMRAAVERRAD